jgi:hypothetical protein
VFNDEGIIAEVGFLYRVIVKKSIGLSILIYKKPDKGGMIIEYYLNV